MIPGLFFLHVGNRRNRLIVMYAADIVLYKSFGLPPAER